MNDDRRRTAIHEAAHAVADVVLGRDVSYVSIRRGKTFRGIAVAVPRDLPEADSFDPSLPVCNQPPVLRADVERKILALLAGDIAALYLEPEPADRWYDDEESAEIARRALVDLGPRIAELVVANEESDEPQQGDEANAYQLANAFVGREAGVFYLEWLRQEATTLVRHYRAAILRVADALERRASLRGHQVAALVHPAKETDHGS